MPRSSAAKPLQQDSTNTELLAAQIDLLYANADVALSVTIVAATLLCLLDWRVVPHSAVIGWWLYMSLLAVARFALARQYWRSAPGHTEMRRWSFAFTLGAGLVGTGWGGAGILLYAEAQLPNQVFLIFVLGGMMLGAASMLAARPEAFFAFLLPTGLGPTLRFAAHADQTHFAMAALAAVFTAATLITTWRIYDTIDSSIRLQFDNRELLEALEVAKNRAEAMNETLELRVQERTAELNESNEQLLRAQQALLNSEKLAVTTRLAATMAHEINNPLAAITNLTYLLSPLQSSSEAREYLATLEGQVQALGRIATQMLKFHRDNNRPTEFRLSAVLDEVSDFYRPQAEKQGVVLHRRIETEGIVVGFKGEIIQVVTNLLLNAIEATPTGGQVCIHLYPAPPWRCDLRRYRGHCVSIADTGRGIDPQYRARIFEPFFTTKGDKGTGLGLWVCNGIVNRVGGSIRVWSSRRPGRSGTCFSVFLPVDEARFAPLRRRYEVGTRASAHLVTMPQRS